MEMGEEGEENGKWETEHEREHELTASESQLQSLMTQLSLFPGLYEVYLCLLKPIFSS